MIDSNQFGRSYRLQIGDLILEGRRNEPSLRIEFSVERDGTTLPNNAEIIIYNLSPISRAKIEQIRDSTCRLEVGYQDSLGQIFFGVLRNAKNEKPDTDWITRLSAGDGEQAFTEAKINRTFAKGTKFGAILTYMVEALGLKPGTLNKLPAEAKKLKLNGSTALKKAATFRGSAATELELLTKAMGLKWSIQDGAFQVLELGKGLAQTASLITPDTGLLEIPSLDKEGVVTGRALLLPDLFPGVPFRLESSGGIGTFVTTKTRHVGDFEGADASWYVEFEGEPTAGNS